MTKHKLHALITADASKLTGELGKASKSTKRFATASSGARAQQQKFSKGSGLMASNLGLLSPRVLSVAGAFGLLSKGIADVVKSGDEVKLLTGRLTALTGEAGFAGAIIGNLRDTAAATGAAFGDLATGASRFTLATRELGASAQEVARFTDIINKYGIIGGASSQEAAAGAIQLGQALASGRLQGEELRSVLEQLPLVARAIADGLDVNIGQLPKLAADGEVTADKVFGAILNKGKEVDEQFAKLPLTVDRASGQLAAAWSEFTAEIDKSYNLSTKTADVLTGLAQGLRGDPAEHEGVLIDRVINTNKKLIEEYQAKIADAKKLKNGNAKELYGVGINVDISTMEGRVRRLKEELEDALYDQNVMLGDTEAQFDRNTQDKEAEDREKKFKQLSDINARHKKMLQEQAKESEKLAQQVAQADVSAREDIARALAQHQGQLQADIYAANKWRDEQLAALDSSKSGYEKYAADVEQIYNGRIAAARDEQSKREQDEINKQKDALEDAAQERSEIAAEELAAQQERLRTTATWQAASAVAFGDLASHSAQAATLMQNSITGAFDGIEDALVSFVTTGKAEIGDLVQSIISDFARLTIKQSVVTPLFAAFTGALGGSKGLSSDGDGSGYVGSDDNLLRQANTYHTGGIAGAPRMLSTKLHTGGVLARDEVPAILQRGEGVFTPMQMNNANSLIKHVASANNNARPQITVNVHEAPNTATKVSQSTDADGQVQLDVVVEQVEAQIGDRIQRGTGLAPVLEQSFGIKKTGQ